MKELLDQGAPDADDDRYRITLSIARIGFAIALLTGLCMFAGIALMVMVSSAAPWKLGVGGSNGENKNGEL